ncbi:uncharacterized protein LOC141620024 [Silene latifolia]|uniref:uncharacterized protein LOC141620024 n=1 Tax=Silene latifolia TaxID=37657 RepID=UPI003D77AA64
MDPSQSAVKDVPQSSDAKSTKSINYMMEIPPIDLDEIVENAISPVVSKKEDDVAEEEWAQVTGRKRSRSAVSSPSPSPSPLLQVTLEDVQPEIEYWSTAVICYVLGGNPLWSLLSGFIQRLWGKYKYDKISFLPNWVFIVRFPTMECQDLVLKQGFPMFNNKPFVVKPWTETASLAKEKIKDVAIWLRLCSLRLKFWGESCLAKFGDLFGKFMRIDGPIMDKTRLGYARLMVEVQVGQELPDKIYFKDEKGNEISVLVEYEWRPDICDLCKGIGHTKNMCKKPVHVQVAPVVMKATQVWRPIIREQPTVHVTQVPSSHSFGGPTIHNSSAIISTSPIIQLVRQEHYSLVGSGASYADVLSPKGSPEKNGGPQITVNVLENSTGDIFLFTVVYGFNDEDGRKSLWDELRQIKDNNSLPWWICGDFNSLLNYNERIGRTVLWREISDFRQCVDYCDIVDIKAQGFFFTWNNKQDHVTRVFSHIDRCLVNNEWMVLYPDRYSYFMNDGLFDHSPMICYRRKAPHFRKTPFRYFNMWGKDPNFKSIVRSEWDTVIAGIPMFQNNYSDIEKSTEVARQQLDHIQTRMHSHPDDLTLLQAEKEAAKLYSELHSARFSFLQQKAKTDWLREGDANTAFYIGKLKLGLLRIRQFIDLIMECVTSPSYSLSLNGNTFGFFKGSRGLRQGDPLSPLLFTLCMDYLSRILNVVGQQSDFKCHPLCKPLRLNHLLFADDLLMFSKGDVVSIMWLLRAFATFSKASGLTLNNDKSDIYFSGVPHKDIDEILLVSRFKRGNLPFKYLGIPISSKKMTKNDGMKLVDKITSKIRAWGARHLSYSGRLTLIRSVLTNMHSYWASVVLIPNSIINKVDALCRNFLCGRKDTYLKTPNVKRDTCCTPKEEGGSTLNLLRFGIRLFWGNTSGG